MGGQLTWTDGVHTVRSPIVVRPVVFACADLGQRSFTVKFGYTVSSQPRRADSCRRSWTRAR
jgi:hypothetical protein